MKILSNKQKGYCNINFFYYTHALKNSNKKVFPNNKSNEGENSQ